MHSRLSLPVVQYYQAHELHHTADRNQEQKDSPDGCLPSPVPLLNLPEQ